MAIFKLIEKPDIVVAYIAIKIPFKSKDELNPFKRLLLLNKVKEHIDKAIKVAKDEIEQEKQKQVKQITIEEVIQEVKKSKDKM